MKKEMDNASAFRSAQYDQKIRQTLPYYEDFYKQIMELVKTVFNHDVNWLDVGCGTGNMGSAAYGKLPIKKFVFCDSSGEMLRIAKERFPFQNAEFALRDVRELTYANEFDVITAIQVNHYLDKNSRKTALRNCYAALKENGIYIGFENFAPFAESAAPIYLEKWKRYQIEQGKDPEESKRHIERYGKEYFPISLSENMELMKSCGFKIVELLWLSNMQAGIWGMK